jgi:hypothetical protein
VKVNNPETGDGTDVELLGLAIEEGNEIEPCEDVCPLCGQSKCLAVAHVICGYTVANSWGGSGFVTIGTNNSRKDLPVKVVIPAPRFEESLFWVVK